MITIDGVEHYGIIYKIENMITHYIYIGQTTHPRGFDGRYPHKGEGIERVYSYLKSKQKQEVRFNIHLLRSIEKCGFDAFEVTKVLDVADSMDELNEKEIYYIKLYDSHKNGFNMSDGGDSASGIPRPKGKDCPNSKRVYQIDLNGKIVKLWDSATEAGNTLKINISSISDVCHGKNRIAGNFVWVFEKDYNPDKNYIPRRIKHRVPEKPVVLLSDDNKIIQEFYNVHIAATELGVSPQKVSATCTHQVKKPTINLKFKSEYLEEQRLNVETLITVSDATV